MQARFLQCWTMSDLAMASSQISRCLLNPTWVLVLSISKCKIFSPGEREKWEPDLYISQKPLPLREERIPGVLQTLLRALPSRWHQMELWEVSHRWKWTSSQEIRRVTGSHGHCPGHWCSAQHNEQIRKVHKIILSSQLQESVWLSISYCNVVCSSGTLFRPMTRWN